MEETKEINKIEIGQDSLKNLDTTRKWTMFLAILGFIGIGMLFAGGIFAAAFLTIFNSESSAVGIPESLVFIIILAFAMIYLFPVLYLFRFSKHTSAAVRNNDKEELRMAFKNLRKYFVFIGVMIIIVLTLYVVIFIAAGASVAFLQKPGTAV
jgi:MFS family permease